MNQQLTENNNLAVLILAAGKGTRMKSDLPKVLHELAGRPLLDHVLDLAKGLGAALTVAVIGYGAELVKARFKSEEGLRYALQVPQLGTGHAVMAAQDQLAGFSGDVLVLYGDVPGLRLATCRDLLAEHRSKGNAMTVLGMEFDEPGAYGRLITDGAQGLEAIVEARDATPEQLKVKLVNSGIYVFQVGPLLANLNKLGTENDQKEYYLTDMAGIFREMGLRVGYIVCPDPEEVAGINSKEELAAYERRLAALGA